MSVIGVTFCQTISKARQALGLGQRELAGRVMKEESGGSIYPQYLDDIEHGRRRPSSGHLIRQFSGILNIRRTPYTPWPAAYRMICGWMPPGTTPSRPLPIPGRR